MQNAISSFTAILFGILLRTTVLGGLLGNVGYAQRSPFSEQTAKADLGDYPSDLLTVQQWKRVDTSIERAVAWLAKQQQRDGSFPTVSSAQPAVTSLAVLAMMAAGHEPRGSKHSEAIERALNFVLQTQRDSGLFSFVKPVVPVTNWHQATHAAMYNHAIAGLMLSESYGMTPQENIAKLTTAIEKGLRFTYQQQRRPGPFKVDDGGWRYLKYLNVKGQSEADLSVTGWHLMFMRSATNAGFDVPTERIKASEAYVRRCFDEERGAFLYGVHNLDRSTSRGMVGAGILSMAMVGQHETKIAKKAGDWLLQHPVSQYNKSTGGNDRFHYGVHYASHGMYQLGGDYWRKFYPTMADTLLSGQLPSGAWPRDSTSDGAFGKVYTTAMAVLSLTPPYQVLPIYQR